METRSVRYFQLLAVVLTLLWGTRFAEEVLTAQQGGTPAPRDWTAARDVAAYRLDRLLGIGMVPVSVQRNVRGEASVMSWWIDDVLMTAETRYFKKIELPITSRWSEQIFIVRVFDELIYNTDRNLGSLVITEDWKLWMTDHTRAFRLHKKLALQV